MGMELKIDNSTFLLQFQSFTVIVTMTIGYAMKYKEICKKNTETYLAYEVTKR